MPRLSAATMPPSGIDSAGSEVGKIPAWTKFLSKFNDRRSVGASPPVDAYVPDGAACFAW